MASVFKVFEAEHQTILTRNAQDKVFNYLANELITMILNQTNHSVLQTLKGIARDLISRFRFSISNLLVEAEKSNQPKRLSLLKELWLEDLN